MRTFKSILLSIFTIGIFLTSSAQTTSKDLTAKLNSNFLTVKDTKTTVVFSIVASDEQISQVKESAAKFTKHSKLNIEKVGANNYNCTLDFDSYEKSVSNYGFAQKMLLNYNITYFEYKGAKYHVKEFINETK